MKELVQYIKFKGERRGVIMAAPINDHEVRIGWSWTATNRNDKFDKEEGKRIAFLRCCQGTPKGYHLPYHFPMGLLDRMSGRALRYFKNHRVLSWLNKE